MEYSNSGMAHRNLVYLVVLLATLASSCREVVNVSDQHSVSNLIGNCVLLRKPMLIFRSHDDVSDYFLVPEGRVTVDPARESDIIGSLQIGRKMWINEVYLDRSFEYRMILVTSSLTLADGSEGLVDISSVFDSGWRGDLKRAVEGEEDVRNLGGVEKALDDSLAEWCPEKVPEDSGE